MTAIAGKGTVVRAKRALAIWPVAELFGILAALPCAMVKALRTLPSRSSGGRSRAWRTTWLPYPRGGGLPGP